MASIKRKFNIFSRNNTHSITSLQYKALPNKLELNILGNFLVLYNRFHKT